MLLPQKNKYEKNLRKQLSVYETEYAKLIESLESEESKQEVSSKIVVLNKNDITSLLEQNGTFDLNDSLDSSKYYVLLDESR